LRLHKALQKRGWKFLYQCTNQQVRRWAQQPFGGARASGTKLNKAGSMSYYVGFLQG